MADDLGDEWWKESDDSNDESTGIDAEEKTSQNKRGVKRRAGSEDSEEAEDSPDEQPVQEISSKNKKRKPSPTKEKGGKKKKKKKTFVKKKITDEDEDTLRKGGTPEDLQKLLKPTVSISKSDESKSVDDDDGGDDDDMLSLDTDFFLANQQQVAGDYLGEVLPGWQVAVSQAKLPPGSPLLLILCSSAIRAVQLNRELKSFLGKECKTAKLFAKHMKLEEQKVFLKKKVCHASIGTPNRVHTLLESGCLKLKQVHAIILDWNWRDVKLKRMVDIPDVRCDLTMLLKEHVVDHIKCTPCRIAIL